MSRMAEERRNRKVEQGEHTRAALLAAARTLFTDKGFAATSTEEIVRAAEVTRGALYHHFADKEALFRAVFELVEGEVCTSVIGAAAKGRDPLDRVIRGTRAYLDLCTEPAVRRIALQDGPAVLGWETWHEIDSAYFFGILEAGVREAMAAGQLVRQPLEPLTHLLVGAIMQAALVLARAEDAEATKKQLDRSMRLLIDGLRAPATQQG